VGARRLIGRVPAHSRVAVNGQIWRYAHQRHALRDGVASKRRARMPAAAASTDVSASWTSSSVGVWRPTTWDSMKRSSTRWGRRPELSRYASAYILSCRLAATRRSASFCFVTSLVL